MMKPLLLLSPRSRSFIFDEVVDKGFTALPHVVALNPKVIQQGFCIFIFYFLLTVVLIDQRLLEIGPSLLINLGQFFYFVDDAAQELN